MASKFMDVCENEEFLTHIDADQLFSLLRRDDLSAPSETFIFKSVMQWIKHKKEERMADAAKVIGAVRLGLVDIRVVIEELDTEQMKRVPEIHVYLDEALIHSYMPSRNPNFAEEKTKTRSTSVVREFPLAKPRKSLDRFYTLSLLIRTYFIMISKLKFAKC